MANSPPSHYLDIGQLGEDLVSQWLQSTGWVILHRRFACRWGEIDIIAEYAGDSQTKNHSTLIFVEVKTRSPGSWDGGGRNAITPKKQTKLWRTAEIFLAEYPQKADYPCRFDVAIVCCRQITDNSTVMVPEKVLASSLVATYQLELREYIADAFDSVTYNA
ncbi:YraN family protein [Fortiea contorta]|uniref:YraN family protein n=1 Tax=Fortiea contorta TaxID=1892405 RepID=UPI00034DC194|nr:YraN family protein [Fortiea contorta]